MNARFWSLFCILFQHSGILIETWDFARHPYLYLAWNSFIPHILCDFRLALPLMWADKNWGSPSRSGCVCRTHNKWRLGEEMFLNISRMTIWIEPQNLWYIPHNTTQMTKDRFTVKMRSQTESSHQPWKSSVCGEVHSSLERVEASMFS